MEHTGLKEPFGTPSPKHSTHLQKPKDNQQKKVPWTGGILKQYSYIKIKLDENKYWLLFLYDIKKQREFLIVSASSWSFGIKLQINF